MWGGITATYFRPESCSTLCIRMWSLVTSCSRGGTLAGSHSRKAGGTQGRVRQGMTTAWPGPQLPVFCRDKTPPGLTTTFQLVQAQTVSFTAHIRADLFPPHMLLSTLTSCLDHGSSLLPGLSASVPTICSPNAARKVGAHPWLHLTQGQSEVPIRAHTLLAPSAL